MRKTIAFRSEMNQSPESGTGANCWERFTNSLQNGCYQILPYTCYDSIAGQFDPGRTRAFELMQLKAGNSLLIVGAGTGIDLNYLPEETNLKDVYALDYSSQMINKCRRRAETLNISLDNILQGDGQNLPFQDQQFDRVYFPLSLGSIPNPQLAMKEAERVLTPSGKIVVYEKLLDDQEEPSCGRRTLNFFTQCIFTNINRNLTNIVGTAPLKTTHYESLHNTLTGCIGSRVESQYKIAVLEKTGP